MLGAICYFNGDYFSDLSISFHLLKSLSIEGKKDIPSKEVYSENEEEELFEAQYRQEVGPALPPISARYEQLLKGRIQTLQ